MCPFKRALVISAGGFLPCETVPNRFYRVNKNLPVFLWFSKKLNDKRINCPEKNADN
jgi:hypothetical protein